MYELSTGKKRFETILNVLWFSLFLFLFLGPKVNAETIKSFDVDITAFKDSSFHVHEKIDFQFGDTQRHGVHRIIPIVYTKDHNDYKIDLRLLDVSGDTGIPYEVHKVISGRKVNFRIGSHHDAMTGRQIITVDYLVRNGVNFFDGAPEIIWNVTGHDWHLKIEKVTCTIHPPQGVESHSIKFSSYKLQNGDRIESQAELGPNFVRFHTEELDPGSHFMIVSGFPKGSIVQPDMKLKTLWWLEDWWPSIVVPLFSAFALGAIYWQFGREPEVIKFSSPEFVALNKKLRPAELGTLIDEKCDLHDIVATVLDLADRGYLTIKQLSKDDPYGFEGPSIQIVKSKPGNEAEPLVQFEQIFMEALFEPDTDSKGVVFLSDLKYNFHKRMTDIKQSIYGRLVQEGYFQTNPHEERSVYYSLALILVTVGAALLLIGQEVSQATAWAVGLLLASGLSAIVAPFMPSKTRKGCQTVNEILSFVEFLKNVSQEEIEDLAKADPNVFSEYLPYCMVLGLEDRWAFSFKDILNKPPQWWEPLAYYGASEKVEFNPGEFLTEIGSLVRILQSELAAVPPPPPSSFTAQIAEEKGGFGGGGFSGGEA